MDVEGNCLVVSPCNACKTSKNGVQACIIRKHNARLTSVRKEDLASRHRQCVKPDQAMTIFKLVDRETGEESVEFESQMVFQRACDYCQHLKSCINAGHTLKDWTCEGLQSRQSKRRALQLSKLNTSPMPKSELTPGPMMRGEEHLAGASGTMQGEAPEDVRRSKRHRTESGGFAKSESAANPAQSPAFGRGSAARLSDAGNGHGGRPGDEEDDDDDGDEGAVDVDVGDDGDGADQRPLSISSQLQAMAMAEDMLRKKFLSDMRLLDEAETSKVKEIKMAGAALEKIRLARKATKESTAEQRRKLAVERQRLTQLRLEEVIRQENQFRQEKEALWNACEAATTNLSEGQAEEAKALSAAALSVRNEAETPEQTQEGEASLLNGATPPAAPLAEGYGGVYVGGEGGEASPGAATASAGVRPAPANPWTMLQATEGCDGGVDTVTSTAADTTAIVRPAGGGAGVSNGAVGAAFEAAATEMVVNNDKRPLAQEEAGKEGNSDTAQTKRVYSNGVGVEKGGDEAEAGTRARLSQHANRADLADEAQASPTRGRHAEGSEGCQGGEEEEGVGDGTSRSAEFTERADVDAEIAEAGAGQTKAERDTPQIPGSREESVGDANATFPLKAEAGSNASMSVVATRASIRGRDQRSNTAEDGGGEEGGVDSLEHDMRAVGNQNGALAAGPPAARELQDTTGEPIGTGE